MKPLIAQTQQEPSAYGRLPGSGSLCQNEAVRGLGANPGDPAASQEGVVMSTWKGSIAELLSEEQIRFIEQSLSGAPELLHLDHRGQHLKRYPSVLHDLDGVHAPVTVIASERPVIEKGLILIARAPLPAIARAVLVMNVDEGHPVRFEGQSHRSRPGSRPEDGSPPRFHFGVFERDDRPPRD